MTLYSMQHKRIFADSDNLNSNLIQFEEKIG